MSGAPVKKLPASPRIGLSRVAVPDRGGEEVNVGFSDFEAGRSNQLRDPRLGPFLQPCRNVVEILSGRSAGNDRKISLGNEFHIGRKNWTASHFVLILVHRV
jgi:hypothetical protein